MGWTKMQLIAAAFDEIGMNVEQFNVGPDMLEAALRKLDTMMATWNGKGIRLGYALPSSPDDSNIDDDSGLADSAYEAAFLNLAPRLAPSVGKQVSNETKRAAKEAYDVLAGVAAFPPAQLVRSLPAGAGNKLSRTGRTFLPADQEPLEATDGSDVIDLE